MLCRYDGRVDIADLKSVGSNPDAGTTHNTITIEPKMNYEKIIGLVSKADFPNVENINYDMFIFLLSLGKYGNKSANHLAESIDKYPPQRLGVEFHDDKMPVGFRPYGDLMVDARKYHKSFIDFSSRGGALRNIYYQLYDYPDDQKLLDDCLNKVEQHTKEITWFRILMGRS